jgi:general secretion pathway protein M
MTRLSQKQILLIAGSVVVLFLASQLVVRPLLKKTEKLAKNIERSEKRLTELVGLEKLYLDMKAENSRVEKDLQQRKQDFTLFAFLEGLASRDGLKRQIEFMRPSVKQLSDMHQEEQVEMRLKGVSLESLIPYLYHIETAPEKVAISRLTIRPQQRNRSQLEVNLVVVTRKLRSSPRVAGSKEA